MCHKGQWGTVCRDETFDTTAANVACKSMGYSSEGALLHSSAVYGKGQGVIWLSGVACSGEESSIDECSHLDYGSLTATCYGHFQDVNIHCQCELHARCITRSACVLHYASICNSSFSSVSLFLLLKVALFRKVLLYCMERYYNYCIRYRVLGVCVLCDH